MPSRSILTPQSPPLITPSPTQSYHHRPPLPSRLVAPIAAASTAAFSLLLCLLVCFRKITRKRTVPSDSKPPHRYSYSVLRRATNSFSPANRLGQGGFGSVFRGTLPASPNNQEQKQIAVKVMDSGSLQGEREFQNELLLASKLESDYVVSVLGFSSDRKRRRMLLVYELMSNGNLQDGLMHKKLPELSEWKKRFSVAVDIAKGIEYLHGLNQPVIHGDIKPSNILLDQYFSARIADFGLSRLKEEEKNVDQCEITVVDDGKMNGGGLEAAAAAAAKNVELESNGGDVVEDYGSVVEETDSVTTTGVEDFNLVVDESPESFIRASPSELLEKGSTSEANVDNAKTSGKEIVRNGVVKDYVMEWIGTEIKKERPKSDWIAATAAAAAASASASSSNGVSTKLDKKKNKKRLDWWMSLDDDDDKENNSKSFKKEKRRPAREWWKEEYCEELAKKKKKKKKKRKMGISSDEDWWPRDEEMYVEKKKSRSRSRSKGSRGSVDWWIDGLSGELFKGRHNSHDSGSVEIPKSGGISSTPSMRGTVCYIAPEYGGGGDLSEKCDVYSFGVLLLVLISGRRPLQVTGSPMSEFQRANLLSWARHLARNGKLIDLVDKAVQSLDREQALLCITVALLCLQKSPARRPSMKEVVAMLTGESQPPQLPTELSPSPPSRLPHKLHKKGR